MTVDPVLLDIGTWREVAAWVALVVIVILLIAAKAMVQHAGSDAEARRQLRSIRPAIARTRGYTIATRDLDGFRDRVRNALLDDEPPEELTVRRALGEVHAAIAKATPALPLVAIRGFLEAIAFVIVGVLVFSSLGVWERALDPEIDPTGSLLAAGDWAVVTATGAMLAFPAAGTVYQVLLTAGVLVADTIWGLWLVIAAYLFIGAVLVAVLDSRITAATATIDHKPLSARELAGRLVVVYLVGVGVAVPMRLAGAGVAADVVGLFAAGVALALLSRTVRKSAVLAATIRGRYRDRQYVMEIVDRHTIEEEDEVDEDDDDETKEGTESIDETQDDSAAWEFDDISMSESGDGEGESDAEESDAWTISDLDEEETEPAITPPFWMDEDSRDPTEWSVPPLRSIVPNLHVKAWSLVLGKEVYAASSALLAPFLIAYLGYFAVSGRAIEVADVLASAPITSQIAIVLLALAGVMGVVRALGNAGERLQQALGRAFRSFSVRTWMFTRGIPVGGAVIVGLAAAAFVGQDLRSALIAVVIATVIAGIGFRFVGEIWMRAKYWTIRSAGNRDRGLAEVVVEPYAIDDADGEPIYVADVAGTRLAHRNPEQLLEDVFATTEQLLENGGSTPDGGWVGSGVTRVVGDGVLTTESRYFAKQMMQGVTDVDRVRKRLRSDVRTRARHEIVAAGGECHVDPLEERLAQEFPDPNVDRQLVELQRRGEIEQQQGRYVLKSQPRAF